MTSPEKVLETLEVSIGNYFTSQALQKKWIPQVDDAFKHKYLSIGGKKSLNNLLPDSDDEDQYDDDTDEEKGGNMDIVDVDSDDDGYAKFSKEKAAAPSK